MRPLRYSINVTLDGCIDHRGQPCSSSSGSLAEACMWEA
jgi:hypothetical protein